jgi:hypothetical protein
VQPSEIMKKVLKYAGIILLIFGLVVRFFNLTPPNVYTVLDLMLDGSVLVGILLLVISAFLKSPAR